MPFAQPILIHVRELLHQAVPELEEAMKWSRPFFLHQGIILGNISAFKQHCTVGLWGKEMTRQLQADGIPSSDSMGTFGRIEKLQDLPADKVLLRYFKQAAAAINTGARTKSIDRPPQRVVKG